MHLHQNTPSTLIKTFYAEEYKVYSYMSYTDLVLETVIQTYYIYWLCDMKVISPLSSMFRCCYIFDSLETYKKETKTCY